MPNAIEVRNLRKDYPLSGLPWQRKFAPALSGVNLDVREGECLSLLGPNGAGKTTLIKILATLILPDSGKAEIAGYDVRSHGDLARSKVGLVTGEERSFYWRLTGRQNLIFFASFYGIPASLAHERIVSLSKTLDIAGELDKKVQAYSAGTKQKLAIARCLLHDPPVLLMDEPTKSLDPYIAESLRQFIKDKLVSKQKKAVFFTTHQTSEAESLSDRIAIIDKGRIRACGSLNDLKEMIGEAGASLYQIFTRLTRDA